MRTTLILVRLAGLASAGVILLGFLWFYPANALLTEQHIHLLPMLAAYVVGGLTPDKILRHSIARIGLSLILLIGIVSGGVFFNHQMEIWNPMHGPYFITVVINAIPVLILVMLLVRINLSPPS